MKIKTKENFIDIIDNDIVWRKKELTYIKSNIKTNSPNFKTYLRSGIVLLYAHWEGFIKNSCEFYLLYIKGQKLNYDELTENFIALSIKNDLTQFENSNKSTIHCQVVDFILNKLNQRASIPSENIIKTGSNLNSNILKEILTTVGLDYKTYELKNNLLDSILLKNRNSIAHGEFIELDELNFVELHNEVIAIMNDIKNRLTNAVVLEEYKKIKTATNIGFGIIGA